MHYVTFSQITLAPAFAPENYGKVWFIMTKKGYCMGVIGEKNLKEEIYRALESSNPVEEFWVF
jgi:hypothetical protein